MTIKMLKNPALIMTFFKIGWGRPGQPPLHHAETQPLIFSSDGNNNYFMYRP
jgi:hypothetical protein